MADTILHDNNTEEEMIKMLEFEGSTQVTKVRGTQNHAFVEQEDASVPKTSKFSPNLKESGLGDKEESLQLSLEQAAPSKCNKKNAAFSAGHGKPAAVVKHNFLRQHQRPDDQEEVLFEVTAQQKEDGDDEISHSSTKHDVFNSTGNFGLPCTSQSQSQITASNKCSGLDGAGGGSNHFT